MGAHKCSTPPPVIWSPLRMTFWAIQTLNGVSFGMLLFLLAAGLSLLWFNRIL
jgi:hypothetical protein